MALRLEVGPDSGISDPRFEICRRRRTFGDHAGHNAQLARGNRLTNTPMHVFVSLVCTALKFVGLARVREARVARDALKLAGVEIILIISFR